MRKDNYPPQSTCPEHVMEPFSFFPNGSSAVTQSTIVGLAVITSITRTGVGVFDVLLREHIDALLCYTPSVGLLTDADVTISSWKYVASTKTLTIRVRSGGAAADIAADADNKLGGILHVKNTKLNY